MIDPNVSRTGINMGVDGIGDFFSKAGNLIGTGVLAYGQTAIGTAMQKEFPERYPPKDFVNGSTGSPKDNAINEANNNPSGQTNTQIVKYGSYALAAVAALATIIYVARK